MEHPVDLVVHVVGYVVGNAIAKRGMQNTETWFLWVIVVVLVLAVYYDGGALLSGIVGSFASIFLPNRPHVTEVIRRMATFVLRPRDVPGQSKTTKQD